MRDADLVILALRSLKTCAETWGDGDGKYLAAAVRFADGFDGWGGFGAEEEDVGLAYPIRQ